MTNTNTKADEFIKEIANPDTCPHCGRSAEWADLDNFDPPFGRAELNYAAKNAWIEYNPNKPREIRVTPAGRKRLTRITKKQEV